MAGQAIYKAGGNTMKRLLLELGGKGAAVVFEDADLDVAVTAIGSVWAFHSGQICTAPTRAIVHRSRYQELVDRLAGMAGTLPVGDPLSEDTIVGPLISAAQRDRVEAYVGAGVDEGADVIVDGRQPGNVDRGFYVGAHAARRVHGRHDSRSARRSSARWWWSSRSTTTTKPSPSPTAPTSASTTTCSPPTARRASAPPVSLRSGNVGINTAQRNMEAPFGGFKMSGIGRDGGDFGLLAYTEMQSVMWPG